MDRRNFLRAAFATAGAAALGAMTGAAAAASPFKDIKEAASADSPDADLPSAQAFEAQGYEPRRYDRDRPRGFDGRGPRDDWRRRPGWRRGPRCWWSRNRWGEPVRRCERF